MCWASTYCHPLAGTVAGASFRSARVVSVACALSSVAAGYVRVAVTVVALSNEMYSYDGPTIDVPSGFFAMGTVIDMLVLAGADVSHPLHASAYPWFIKKPSPASAADVGL